MSETKPDPTKPGKTVPYQQPAGAKPPATGEPAAVPGSVSYQPAAGDQATVSFHGVQSTQGGAPSPRGKTLLPSIPGYEVLGELGRGGMGVVYKARQIALKRLVALKMILSGARAGEQDLARFKAEAQAVAKLQHANIVQVYEVGEFEGLPYFSLEFVEGGSLADRLKGTPQPAGVAAILVQQLAEAMHAAHERDIVHRDLKPANVLLTGTAVPSSQAVTRNAAASATGTGQGASKSKPDGHGASPLGTPKITDFGLAKQLDGEHSGKTVSGAIMGTPSYMAPEQASGRIKDIGPLADVYALGAILYEMLTGRPPFKGATILETLEQVRMREPVAPTALQPGIPRDLETICLKCLEKDPRRRYDSALALAEDLRRYIEGEPIKARPVGTVERAVKWAKRRPAIASLLATIFLLVAAAGTIVTILYLQADAEATAARKAEAGERDQKVKAQVAEAEKEKQRKKAVENETEAIKQTKEAIKQTKLAEQAQGRLAFPSAHAALRDCNLALADERLDLCPADERAFEWWHLKRFVNSELIPNTFNVSAVTRIAFHPGGRKLALAGGPGILSLWDLANDRRLPNPPVGKDTIEEFAFHPDGKRAIIARTISGDKRMLPSTVIVLELDTGKVLHVLVLGTNKLTCFSMSLDGRRIAAGDSRDILAGGRSNRPRTEGIVRVWETDSGKEVTTIKIDSGLTALALSPDGDRLMTGCVNGSVQFWTASTGKEISEAWHSARKITSLAWSPKERGWAIADESGTVSVGAGALKVPTHPGAVNKIVFSPDGRFLATACDDHVARVYDVMTGTEVHRVLAHTAPVVDLAFSPNSQLLATAANDNTVKIWEAHGGQAGRVLGETNMPVTALSISGDNRRVAFGDETGRIVVQDLSTSLIVMTAQVYNGAISGVALNRDGSRLAAVSGATFSPLHARAAPRRLDTSLNIWDVNGRKLLSNEPANGLFSGVAYCSDSVLATSCYGPNPLTFHDATTGKVIRKTAYSGPGGLSVSPDGRYVALNGLRRISVVEVATGKELFASPDLRTAMNFSWSPDSKRLACSLAIRWHSFEERLLGPNDSKTVVRVWDVPSGQVVMDLNNAGYRVLYTPDGLRLIGIGYKEMKFWDAGSGQVLLEYPFENPGADSVAISGDGRYLVVSTSEHYKDPKQWSTIPGRVKVFDAPRELPVLTLRGHTESIKGMVFTRDGSQIVSSADNTVRIWALPPDKDRAAGSETSQIRLTSVHAGPVALFPRGDRIVVAENYHYESDPGGIRIREVASGRQLLALEDYVGEFPALALSPDEKLLATSRQKMTPETSPKNFPGQRPPELRVWDAQTGKLLRTLEGHKFKDGSPVAATDLIFHPDGRRLASSVRLPWNPDLLSEVKVWDATTGQMLRQFPNYLRPAFSSDGRLLAAVTEDHIQIWEVDTGNPVRKLTLEGKPRIDRIAFRADGRCLAGIVDETVVVWDLRTGARLLCFREMRPWKPMTPFDAAMRPADSILPTTLIPNLLAFSPDGSRLAAGFHGGFIKVWEVPLVEAPGGELVPRTAIALSFYLHSVAAVTCSQGRLLAACGEQAEGAALIADALDLWDRIEYEHTEVSNRVEERYFATVALARLYRDAGRSEKADALDRKAEAIKTQSRVPPVDETPLALADRCLERALKLRKEGRHDRVRDSATGAQRLYESIANPKPEEQQQIQAKVFNAVLIRGMALTELKDWKAAMSEWQQAEQRFGPRPEMRIARALTFAKSGDHARAVAESVQLGLLQIPVKARFTLARILGLAIDAAREDKKLQAAERDKLIERYAGMALAVLDRCWRMDGFNAYPDLRERLGSEKDLNSLRDRPDFQKFIDGVKKKPRP